MSNREVMQQALEALEELDGLDTETECVTIDVGEVITALREALAQPEQKPMHPELRKMWEDYFDKCFRTQPKPTCPECKAAVLYECVACSSNNYPPKREQEPTGYWDGKFSKDGGATLYEVPQESMFGRKYPNIPLYATPPAVQRTWVGLDEDDIRKLYGKDLNYRDGNYVRYAMAVEAKLKEKNGY